MMMKIIMFLGFIALSQCQPLEYFYNEDQQPNAYYYPGEFEAANRARRSADDYYVQDLYEDNEQQNIEEAEYIRQRRSIPENSNTDDFRNEHPALALYYYPEEVEQIESLERQRRSLQPGAPTFPLPNQQPATKVTPHVTHQDGTTNIGAKVDHKFGNHDASAHWNKNVRGPGRSKPNYGVRGTFRF